MARKPSNILLIILLALACIVSIAFTSALLDYFSRGSQPATPTPPPVLPPSDPWERIRSSGKMVVGSSLDYPPFSFYNETFQPDGFDIALIREIGQALGVAVEIKDMSFDGLAGALQLQQIDVAISAISVTPEREALFDFSNIYFVSDDAILANQNANIAAINSVTQLAAYRVGVQRSTVYQRWLQESLVDTGIMPAERLQIYQQASQAIEDVRNGRIDLAIVDLPVGQTAVATGGLRIVGQGLNPQRLAIALVNGAATTQAQINNALIQIQNSGRLNALVQQYLGLSPGEIVPPPTPLPVTATPFPTATPIPCIDQMTFVQDLNLDDNNMTTPPEIAPGQPFRKWWRIRNSGTCTWDNRYALVFVNGNSPLAQMGGQPAVIQGSVAPGQTYDIFVDLVSPLTPGTYQAFWSMRNAQGRTFGDRIWVGIRVPSPATATPAPTQTPSANIQFTVDRSNITAGQCVTFNWNVVGARAVYFFQRGQNWQNFPVPAVGTRSECPPETTVYQLRVDRLDNTVEVREITVLVQPVIGAPVIHRFTVTPADQLIFGQCVTLNWWVEGRITTIRLLRDNVTIWDSAPVNGSTSDCPTQTGITTYRIEATGPGGTTNQSQTINVVAPAQPTATPQPNTPTAVPPTATTAAPPQILTFNVSPTQIQAGNCVSINWSVGGSISTIRLLRNGAAILDNAPASGAAPDCLTDAGSYVYRLEANGSDGRQDVQERTVTVTAVTTIPPLAGTSWKLSFYYDGVGALVSVINGTEITALFGNDGQLTGTGGCNTYNGRFTGANGQVTITGLSSTNIACGDPPGIMEQEGRYFQLVPQAATYQINPNELIIKDMSGQVILRYEPLISPR
ncbi:MAG: transporter substrate-binding domain-containing protein [Chloroflexi bacterium]|nr:transporter substrate-binding domain-containing protein [Chloroflexota bacterium]MBP7042925.1 transporter substrate-binding domain-containing protein [Chloroflexota bacterium]